MVKLGTLGAVLGLVLAAAAGSAGAATVITDAGYTLSDTSFGTGMGVHFDGTQSAPPSNALDAKVDQDLSAVVFTSTDPIQNTGSGEAFIGGQTVDRVTNTITNLDVNFAKSWEAITFAFSVPTRTTSDMSIFINGSATPIFDALDCASLCVLGNGENKFTVSSPAGIDQLDFSFTGQGIDTAKQFRVSGVVPPVSSGGTGGVGGTGGAVPEPATWAMMILGVAAIGFAFRRREAGLALAG